MGIRAHDTAPGHADPVSRADGASTGIAIGIDPARRPPRSIGELVYSGTKQRPVHIPIRIARPGAPGIGVGILLFGPSQEVERGGVPGAVGVHVGDGELVARVGGARDLGQTVLVTDGVPVG